MSNDTENNQLPAEPKPKKKHKQHKPHEYVERGHKSNFWQHNPDKPKPAKLVEQSLKNFEAFKKPIEVHRAMRKIYICPHCGHVGKQASKSMMKHFGYCEHKDTTLSIQELQAIRDARPEKALLMGQYGDWILTHEELLQVLSTVALDKKDSVRPIALKLLMDYHDTINNRPDEAKELGFTGFTFTILNPVQNDTTRDDAIEVHAKDISAIQPPKKSRKKAE